VVSNPSAISSRFLRQGSILPVSSSDRRPPAGCFSHRRSTSALWSNTAPAGLRWATVLSSPSKFPSRSIYISPPISPQMLSPPNEQLVCFRVSTILSSWQEECFRRVVSTAEKFCYLVREIGEKGRVFATFATRTGPEKSERGNTVLPIRRLSPAPTLVVHFQESQTANASRSHCEHNAKADLTFCQNQLRVVLADNLGVVTPWLGCEGYCHGSSKEVPYSSVNIAADGAQLLSSSS